MDAAPSAPIPLIALVGNPNCGKTALFNMLTGSRQKVANYAGVTVERKEGSLLTPSGLRIRILDLPGAYSLDPLTPDEQVTADVLLGGRESAGFCRVRDRRDQSAPEPTIGVEP
jgi:ferrous iron transport protein B